MFPCINNVFTSCSSGSTALPGGGKNFFSTNDATDDRFPEIDCDVIEDFLEERADDFLDEGRLIVAPTLLLK